MNPTLTPPPETAAMERHRHNHVAAGKQFPPGALQPLAKSGHQIQPVGMLQSQDRGAADIVITQDGAGLVEGRRMGKTGGAFGIVEAARRQAGDVAPQAHGGAS